MGWAARGILQPRQANTGKPAVAAAESNRWRVKTLAGRVGGPAREGYTSPQGCASDMTQDPVSQRKQHNADDFALTRDAIRWLASLPDPVRPIELGRKFPRIINTIAAKWADFIGCRRYLNSLQIDDRGGRQGFPFEIVQEICTLREYFDSLYPPDKDLWQKAIDANKR